MKTLKAILAGLAAGLITAGWFCCLGVTLKPSEALGIAYAITVIAAVGTAYFVRSNTP